MHFERSFGEMAEWSIASVLKTDVLRGTGGSNPSLSAETKFNPVKVLTYNKLGLFLLKISLKSMFLVLKFATGSFLNLRLNFVDVSN